jgi:hypothetical protein
MRPAAEVQPLALAVDRNRFAIRQVADQLCLVAFAAVLEEGDGRLTVPFLAHETGVAGDDVAHARLDGREIVRRKRLIPRKIVVKAVVDGRPDGDLRAWIERLHSLGQHMRDVVPDHRQCLRITPCDEHHGCVSLDDTRQIPRLPVHFHGQSRASKARPDTGGDVGAGHRAIEAADGAVGQRNSGHVSVSSCQSSVVRRPLRCVVF